MKKQIAFIFVALLVVGCAVILLLYFDAQRRGREAYEASDRHKEIQRRIDESEESIARSEKIIEELEEDYKKIYGSD